MSQSNSSSAATATAGNHTPVTVAYLMLIACAMMWGSNHVVARGVNATVPFEALAFWGWVVAVMLVFPVWFEFLGRDLRIMAQHKMSMFLIGFTGVFLFSVVIYLAAYNTVGGQYRAFECDNSGMGIGVCCCIDG